MSSYPIIAITANALKGDAEKALAAGCDVYMSKKTKAAIPPVHSRRAGYPPPSPKPKSWASKKSSSETFGWELPDVIVYPTGGGTGLVGMWKAFAELEALGWLENPKRPRMVSVQAEGCAPVVAAFEKGAQFCDFWLNAHTIASGLRVPKSFADHLILEDIRKSHGTAVSVSDAAILEAQKQLASLEGLFAAPEGAATLAAARELARAGWLQPHESVVLFNTGSGLKYLDYLG